MSSEGDQLISQTLHHVATTPVVTQEIDREKQGYFQRMIARPKQQSRSHEDQQIPIATPKGPAAYDSEEFPAIKKTYYFADCILSSERASPETLAFVDIIQQVRQDVEEAKRLCVSVAVSNFLDAYPSKQTWIDECLQETQKTLNDIGMDMDSAWGRDEDGGIVASKRKFEWGLKNQKKPLKREQQLKQCHAQLMGAIHVMQTVELCNKSGVAMQQPIFEAPVRPWVPRSQSDTLRGPYSRQKHRLGYNFASVSSLNLTSENDRDDLESRFNTTS